MEKDCPKSFKGVEGVAGFVKKHSRCLWTGMLTFMNPIKIITRLGPKNGLSISFSGELTIKPIETAIKEGDNKYEVRMARIIQLEKDIAELQKLFGMGKN